MAVVGAGLVGLSAAWWLGRAGRRGVVLEGRGIAAGATGRSSGSLLTGAPEPFGRLAAGVGEAAALRLWEVSRENRELLRREVLDPGVIDCDFLPEGSWIAALGDDAAGERELAEGTETLVRHGFEVEWRDAAAVRRASGSPLLGGALYQPRDGGLDPVALCRGLAAASGFEVRTGWPVRALEPRGDRLLLAGEAGAVLAGSVVVAVNAYLASLLPGPGAVLEPVRAQMLATAPGERTLAGVWHLDAGREYARQLADGTFLLGGRQRAAPAPEVGFLAAPTATVQGALDDFLRQAFPALAGRRVAARWAGILALTANRLPAVGEVPDLPGAVYAAGFSGRGLSLGFAAGRHLARLACGEEPAPLFPEEDRFIPDRTSPVPDDP